MRAPIAKAAKRDSANMVIEIFIILNVNHQYCVPTIYQWVSYSCIFETCFDYPKLNYQATAWDVFVTSASVPSVKWRIYQIGIHKIMASVEPTGLAYQLLSFQVFNYGWTLIIVQDLNLAMAPVVSPVKDSSSYTR